MRRTTLATIRRSPTLYHSAKTVQASIVGARRAWWRARRGTVVRRYLDTHEIKKLELGTGGLPADGWLNTDLNPRAALGAEATDGSAVIFLDATKRFPFADAVFHYVRAEHMVEHLGYSPARSMLEEVARVLRPGGRLRIATPDLGRLVGLYEHRRELRPDEAAYVQWTADYLMGNSNFATPTFVLNNAFRAWGHEFLFDEETLRTLLSDVGFTHTRRFAVGASDDPVLVAGERHACAVENEQAVEFETLVLETEKPA